MPKFKLVWTVFLVAVLIGLFMLPNPGELDLSDQLRSLPDADLRQMAEEFSRNGEEETALMVLDYLVDNDMGDTAAAMQLRNDYLAKLQSDKTPFGRLKAAGWGFATGKVKSFESLAGSTVGDLFVWGDLRDLGRELVFEKDTDEFVVALAGIGVLTTFYPPADPPVSILKAARKTKAVGEPLARQMTKICKVIIDTPGETAKVEKLKDNVMPFWELSRQTRTWTEYKTLLRHADSVDQIKVLTRMAAHSPGNSKKLTQILSIAGKQGADEAKRCIDLMMQYGQKGMDSFYAALRKGPRGMRFIADHPTLVARGLKNVEKVRTWGLHEVNDFARRWGASFQIAKLLVIGLVSALLFHSLMPLRLLQVVAAKAKSGPGKIWSWFTTQWGAAAAVGLAVAMLWLVYSAATAPVFRGGETTAVGDTGGGASGSSTFNPALSVAMIALTLILQGGIWTLAQSKLRTVVDVPEPHIQKLKRLENLDIFFDLPLYCGLFLTICAFILITIDAGVSRILAYSSTVIGILSAVSLRVYYLYPLRDRLLTDVEMKEP
ncbi:MAG: hypothetical protein NTY01_07465 [Verrucomicrobia bacterium]|nr:hypothetical protein [Verrucomicrobiota bacterium]